MAVVEGDFPLDEAIFEAFPTDWIILSANQHGHSSWAKTARLSVQLPDGTAKQFFLKTSSGSGGRAIVEGEYHAMTALYNTAPDFAPKPYTWGTFRQGAPETHFFICDFIRMSDDMPDPAQFCSQLAELHKNSVSPTGKFGFHISTCHGQFKQALEWDGNWASFFAKLLKEVLVFDESVNGVWPAFHTVAERTLSHVIPRLLGVLQKDGRYLRPSLIHGDLWEGNVATDSETGQIYVFDAGAYYAHHEMELGMWRCNRHKICRNEEYKRQYLEHMAISEPVEEFDDRNRLYCVKVNVLHSAHHPGTIDRVTAYNDMCYLVEKYAPYLPLSGQGLPRSKVQGGLVEAGA